MEYRTQRLDRRMRWSQIGLFLVTAVATLTAAIALDEAGAMAEAVILAWFALDSKDQTEQSLVQYNQTLAALVSTRAWWDALSASEKVERYNVERLVVRTENALKMETAGWAQLYLPGVADRSLIRQADWAGELFLLQVREHVGTDG
jgi:hypothetical protein